MLHESEIPDGIAKKRWFRTLGIVSVIIAVPTALLSIPPVQEWFFERDPKLSIEFASEIPIVNLNRGMDGLTVTLNGESLNAEKETLVATKIILRNYGKSGIGPNDVSTSDPIGFRVNGGNIVELTGFSASTSHLRKFSNPILKNNEIIIGSNIIIDSGDSLTFDVIVKKPSNSNLTIFSSGKVSNLDKIKIVDSRTSNSSESFLEETFLGGIWIQSARTIIYSLIGLSTAAGAIQIAESTSSLIKTRKRRKREAIALQFLAKNADGNKISNALAAAIYHALGKRGVKFFLEIVQDYKKIDDESRISPEGFSRISDSADDDPSFFEISKYLAGDYVSRFRIQILESTFNISNSSSKTVQMCYIKSLESALKIAHDLDPSGDFERSPKDGSRYVYQED